MVCFPCESWVVSHKITQWALPTYLQTVRLVLIDTHLKVYWQLFVRVPLRGKPSLIIFSKCWRPCKKIFILDPKFFILYMYIMSAVYKNRAKYKIRQSKISPGFCSLMHKLIYTEVEGKCTVQFIAYGQIDPLTSLCTLKSHVHELFSNRCLCNTKQRWLGKYNHKGLKKLFPRPQWTGLH